MRKPVLISLLFVSMIAVAPATASAQYLGVGGDQQGELPPANTPGGSGGGLAGDEQGDDLGGGAGGPGDRSTPLSDGGSLPNPNNVNVADEGSSSGADLPFTGLQIALLGLAAIALISAGLAIRFRTSGRPA